MQNTIQSPCVQQCNLDPKLQQCVVCKRTLKQIVEWQYYTPEYRQQIMDSLR
jgi:predicted Fe-S protein YdhL (DUF1289 family)